MATPTADDFRRQITDPNGVRTLTLTPNLLPSPDFDKMLALFGNLPNVTLQGVEIQPDEEYPGDFTVSGQTALFGFPPTLFTLAIEVDDDTFNFTFSGALDRWKLQDIVQHGLFPPETLQPLDSLRGSEFAEVAISYDSLGQYLTIQSSESERSLPLAKELGFGLDRIGFVMARSFEDETASLYLIAEIEIGGEPLLAKLTVPIPGFSSTDYWELTQTAPFQLTAGLEGLLGFVETALPPDGRPPGFRDKLPKQVTGLPSFFLQDFRLLFDPIAGGGVGLVSFDIETSHPISIVADKFVIERVGMRLLVMPSTGGTVFTLELFGTIEIEEGVVINLTASIPSDADSDWVFTIEGVVDLDKLTGINKLPGQTEAADLHLPQASHDVEIQVRHFELDFNPRQGTLSSLQLDIRIQADFEVTHNLHIENPRLTLNLSHPFDKTQRTIAGSLSGTITVGKLPFQLTAEKKTDGWAFSGSVAEEFLSGPDLHTSLADMFGVGNDLPEFLQHIHLTDLGIRFETSATESGSAKEIEFHCGGRFYVHEPPKEDDSGIEVHEPPKEVDNGIEVHLKVTVTQSEKDGVKSFRADVDANVAIGEEIFDLHFLKAKDALADKTLFAASFSGGSKSYDLQTLIRGISIEIGDYVPAGLSLSIKDVVLGYMKDTKTQSGSASFLFAVGLGAELKLSDLPLVGSLSEATLAVKDLRVIVASQAITMEETEEFNRLLPGAVTPLPTSPIPTKGLVPAANEKETTPPDAVVIGQYFNFRADLQVGSFRTAVGAQIGGGGGERVRAVLAVTTVGADRGSTLWIDLQKSFGPVSFRRIGVRYQGDLYFLLDASFATGGLDIAVLGLGLHTPITKFEPHFNLDGLALTFSEGPVELSGALVGTIDPEPNFYGELLLRVSQFSLSALGAYAQVQGHPSFFLYAVIDYPIGGPGFFFVTGLAAGFGFNRKLLIPDVTGVATFPLVQWAVGEAKPPPGESIGEQVNKTLEALTTGGIVAPEIGAYWLALGVHFTSFKVVDSFALLTVSFGTHFEIDLLGLSSLTMPPVDPEEQSAVPPVAVVELALKASFTPEIGLLGIAGQLTSRSFVFSQAAHLTGGFAFYAWFSGDHEGDFVVSLGGYSSRFTPPPHYPQVPRLGLNWQVVPDELVIKGDLFFTLTSNAVMAGGGLSAVWERGSVRAWFDVEADFLMVFRPFHYYLHAGIHLGVSFQLNLVFTSTTITLHLGVDLDLWGPPFAGTATVDLWILSFTIHFPAGSQPANPPQPLAWDEFVRQLLPTSRSKAPAPRRLRNGRPMPTALRADAQDATPAIVQIVASAGLRKTLSEQEGALNYIMSGELCEFTTQTAIPAKTAIFHGQSKGAEDKDKLTLAQNDRQPARKPNTAFGVGPTGTINDDFGSEHTITISSDTASRFRAVRVLRNVPKALWGYKTLDKHGLPENTDPVNDTTVPDVLVGFQLVPDVPEPEHTFPVPLENLQYDRDEKEGVIAWSRPDVATTQSPRHDTVLEKIMSPTAQNNRKELLAALTVGGWIATDTVDVGELAERARFDLMAEPTARLLGEELAAGGVQ